MLKDLLKLLRKGQNSSIQQLAQQLGTTETFVQVMLEDLERRGYVRSIESSCKQQCASCSVAGACTPGRHGRVWLIKAPSSPR